MRPLTRSCFLLLVLGRLFLLALPFVFGICFRSLWSPSILLHAFTLISHLESLPPHDLVLWTNGSVPFPFGKDSSGVLVNSSRCGTEATLSFSAGPVCSSFFPRSASFCTLFAGLGSTIKSAISLLFSSCLTLVLSSPPCTPLHFPSYLKLCGRSGSNCLLSPILLDYNGSPDTRFSWGKTRLTSWPDGERYLRPPQSLVVSLLLSLVSTLVFSRTGGALSHLNSLTHRFL